MKNILVTGAAGFIGSHLTELLVKEGYRVKAFVRYNSRNNWGWLESSDVKDGVEMISGDIRDYDSVYNALKECDTVFHLAALIGIPYSYVSPKAYIETNISGTYNVLQASKAIGLEQVLITSTSETYGTAQYVPIDEKHPLVGQSPYSASKIGADQIAISYYRSFMLPVRIVRPFNTYGPRQSARAIIPTVISQILSGKRELELGNVKPTRDFTFVTDTARGFLEIFKSHIPFGEIVNIGNGNEISIGDLVALISELMGKDVKPKNDESRVRPVNSEVERLLCNNEKLLSKTSWTPRISLREGLMKTIDWIQNNFDRIKTDIYNV
jgi:NAD dependent epimerase/dehydratase